MNKQTKFNQHHTRAAESMSLHTTEGRERAAHHLTAANAIKRGQVTPKATVKALRK